MALPHNQLSSTPVPSPFSGAKGLTASPFIDYEDGGVAINDASRGLLYQRWRAALVDNRYVYIEAANTPQFLFLYLPGTTEISLSFDSNMQPVLAFVQGGEVKLYWYDSVSAGYVTTNFGSTYKSPRVALDDHRYVASNGFQLSDVIFAYVRANNLYYRQQRDRYLTERLLHSGLRDDQTLLKIGLNRKLRFQFMVSP